MTEATTPIGGFNQEILTEFMKTLLAQHAPKFAEFLDGREATEEELSAYAELNGFSVEQILSNTGLKVSDVLEMFAAYKAEEVVTVEAPTQEVVAVEATKAAANENTPCESKCAPDCNGQAPELTALPLPLPLSEA
jgi:hypothetical protein